ncbi:putative GRAM domain-containing protein 1B-like [Scophthalmus maximus]|uniref:Putative GRAM domain-containing protein 1B-like n=1 Tax=Scophthalmus maximus TaxID=52904 RepID=A0A2U9B6B7_SCOMX|nr:putative GRAM domain-containing protein 1B-like [Scophthalmus maximus]
MSDTLRPPSLQVSVPNDAPAYSDGGGNVVSDGAVHSSSSTPTLRRKRFKMRRMRNVPSERELEKGRLNGGHLAARSHSSSKEYLQLPSIEITPSSDEDGLSSWSRCSTPSASPRRKRFLLRKWLKVREKKEQVSESRSDSAADKFRGTRGNISVRGLGDEDDRPCGGTSDKSLTTRQRGHSGGREAMRARRETRMVSSCSPCTNIRSIKGNRVRFTGPVDGGHGGRGPGRNGFRSAAPDKHSWPGQAKEVEETDMETSKVGHDCNSSTKRHRTHTSSHIIIIQ